jgi:aminoglycoside phosphotransferase (APT) family kinase protein
MAAQVPSAERLKSPPPWALARVPGLEDGEPPLMLAPLGGGSVNEVFRVDSRLGRFVVRLNGPAWRRPGVDRERELALYRAAAAAGIAPQLVAADPQADGLLIMQYQDGRVWREQDFEDVAALRRLGERLQLLHSLPAPAIEPFDPWSVAQGYLRQIAEPPAAAALARLEQSCAALGRQSASAGACMAHGDLAQNNLLEGQQLWLLDWEYAQLSDPLMDLACVLAYYPAAMRHRAEFAAAAGLSAQAAGEALAQRITIYQALSWLWHLARGEPASWDWHPDVPAGKLAGP